MFVLSVDDKGKVPIGVTAANKQTPLIMHVDYEVRLPDYDFVKATKHKPTPSVYAACKIRSASSKTAPEISYSGPTYIAIRSGKHDSSTAYSHGRDFDYALELEEFQSVVKNDGEIKSVAIFFQMVVLMKTHVFPKPLMWLFSILRTTTLTHFLFLRMHQVCLPTIKLREEWLH